MVPERRYRAIIEYDGTNFLGFQLQAKGRTVQGEIEACLKRLTHVEIRIDSAGRTDAGVHATGQVIAFNLAWRHPLADLQRALNANLPEDITISDLKITDLTFHPRFSALSRTYHYRVINQPWPSALQRRYAYHVAPPLNLEAMNQAGRLLLGSHDFASFGKPTQGNSTVRTVLEAGWSTQTEQQLLFKITANAFLYRMVRKIVGTLIRVGLGWLTVEDMPVILAARDLTQSAPPAPACGLYLVKVTYPEGL